MSKKKSTFLINPHSGNGSKSLAAKKKEKKKLLEVKTNTSHNPIKTISKKLRGSLDKKFSLGRCVTKKKKSTFLMNSHSGNEPMSFAAEKEKKN